MPQQVVKHELQYNDFKTCLTTGDIKYNDFFTIRSVNHNLHTFHCNRISLNVYDNKKVYLELRNIKLAYGHYQIKQMIEQ